MNDVTINHLYLRVRSRGRGFTFKSRLFGVSAMIGMAAVFVGAFMQKSSKEKANDIGMKMMFIGFAAYFICGVADVIWNEL